MRRSDVFCGVINQYKHLKMENTQKTVIDKLSLSNAKVTLKFHKVKFLFLLSSCLSRDLSGMVSIVCSGLKVCSESELNRLSNGFLSE